MRLGLVGGDGKPKQLYAAVVAAGPWAVGTGDVVSTVSWELLDEGVNVAPHDGTALGCGCTWSENWKQAIPKLFWSVASVVCVASLYRVVLLLLF